MSVTVADLVRIKSRYVTCGLHAGSWKNHPAQSWIAAIPEEIVGVYLHDPETAFDTLVFTDQALWKWNKEAVRVAYATMRQVHLPFKEAIFDYGLRIELDDGQIALFPVKGEKIPDIGTTRLKDLYTIGTLMQNIIHHFRKAT